MQLNSLLFCLFFILHLNGYGQNAVLDSLNKELKRTDLSDSLRMEAHLGLSWELRYSDVQAARTEAKEYLKIGRKLNHPPTEGMYLERIGVLYRINQQVDSAYYCFTKALEEEYYHEPQHESEFHSLRLRIAVVEGQRNNMETAEIIYKEVIEYYESIEYDPKLLYGYVNYAGFLSNIGKKAESVELQIKAFRLAEEKNNNRVMKYSAINICSISLRFDCFGSEEFCNKAMELSKNDTSPVFANAANVLAACHIKSDEFEKAEALLYQSIESTKERTSHSYSYYYLGVMYEEQSLYDSAGVMYQSAIDLSENIFDTKHKGELLNRMARISIMTKQKKNAYQYAKQSVELYDEAGVTEIKVYANSVETLLRAASLNEKHLPIELVDDYISLRDTLAQVDKATRLNELIEEYQSEKKDLQNQKLEQDIAMQTAQYETQRNYLLGAGAVAVLLSLLAGFAWYQRQRVQRLNGVLNNRNEKIETLMKELSHRVKNNLQLTGSLLELQMRRVTNEEAKSVLTESKNRINVLNALYRKLYNSGENIKIDVAQYLVELCADLENAFQNPNLDFKVLVEKSSNAVYIDADSTVRIGLIVNELVTNSVKYAFENIENPLVEIELTESESSAINLSVRDNGVGMKKVSNAESKSLGTKLIKGLTKELKGTMYREVSEGTKYVFSFPNKD